MVDTVHGPFLARITGVGSHSLLQGDLHNPGIKPGSLALQVDSLPTELPGNPECHMEWPKNKKDSTIAKTWKQPKCPSTGMDKEDVDHIYHGILTKK